MGEPSEDFPKDWTLEIGGVICAIYLGPDGQGYGITESVPTEGRSATVVFQCYWRDRIALTAGLLGTVDYQGGTVVRTDPYPYPVSLAEFGGDHPLLPNRLFCTSISSITGTKWRTDNTGENTGTMVPGWGEYIFALVTAEFTTPPYLASSIGELTGVAFNDLLGQLYAITKLRVSGEVFAPPSGAIQYAEGANKGMPIAALGVGRFRSRFELSVTRVRMPLIPMTLIGNLLNTVNEDPFMIGSQSFAKGSVLFSGCNPEPRNDPYNGGIVYDLELLFLVNGFDSTTGDATIDWNMVLDPTGNWVRIEQKTDPLFVGSGDPVFRYAPLDALFDNTVA